MSDGEDRTYEPTAARREQFRKEGRFARSRDAGALAATAGAALALVGTRDGVFRAVETVFTRTLGDPTALARGEGGATLSAVAFAFVALCGPMALAAALGAIALGLAQGGVRFDLDLASFKAERLDPFAKLKQVFSPKHALVETAMAMLRVGAIGFVAYATLSDEIPPLLALASGGAVSSLEPVTAPLVRLTLKMLGALAVLSALDYAQSRFSIEKQLKMTLKELKDEMRSQDGDPKVKARMRSRARALAKKRMMADVKTSDVVVANPTHVSVALRYGPRDPAPIVVAKGHDDVALRIRAEARKHGVPVVESRALARALDAEIAIGKPIRGAHFAAVAKVLAHVYKLRKRAAG